MCNVSNSAFSFHLLAKHIGKCSHLVPVIRASVGNDVVHSFCFRCCIYTECRYSSVCDLLELLCCMVSGKRNQCDCIRMLVDRLVNVAVLISLIPVWIINSYFHSDRITCFLESLCVACCPGMCTMNDQDNFFAFLSICR